MKLEIQILPKFIRLSTLFIWSILQISSLTFLLAQTNATTTKYQEAIEQAEQQYGARIGLELIRCQDWQSLYCHRENELMTPASVIKILSTGAALRLRGADYRFSTYIFITGDIVDGILNGTLNIHGTGDPSIGSRHIDNPDRLFNELIEVLTNLGIHHIAGAINLYSGHPEQGVHQSWMLEDIKEPYGAGFFGLNYADNTTTLGLHSPLKPDSVNITEAQPSGIHWHNAIRQGRSQRIQVDLTPTTPEVRIRGILPRGINRTLRIAHPAPALALGRQLEIALSESNISTSGQINLYNSQEEPTGKLIHTYHSPTLRELSHITNRESQNLYAEAIGSLITGSKGNKGEELTYYWTERLGLTTASIRLIDGSGLSRLNQISPKALALSLVDLMGGILPHDGIFVETLPEVGVEGTVRTLTVPYGLKSYLKSGTMRGISCYAGYIYYDNEWYILAYMANGLPSARQSRELLYEILNNIFHDNAQTN